MNKSLHHTLVLLLIIIGINSCSPVIETEQDLYKWINNPENGLIKIKRIAGLKLSVKFLPAQYLAFKEDRGKNYSRNKQVIVSDSLLNKYGENYTFLLNIRPDTTGGRQNRDIMYQGAANYEQYRERAIEMNFNFSDYISLRTGDKEKRPALTTLENTYSLTDDRNIYVIFSKPDTGSDEVDFIYNDEFFGTGISHFVFKRADLENFPEIEIIK